MKKKCSVSRSSGVAPVSFERGSIRSTGSSVLPQLSHWSPRASGEAAVRAGALDVAVGQEAVGLRVVELLGGPRVDVAVGMQRPEHLLRDLAVVVGLGGGEEVERDAELAPSSSRNSGWKLVDDLLPASSPRWSARHGDRACRAASLPETISTSVAGEAVVAREDVGRQVRARDVAEVQRAVGVRPGDGDEDVTGRGGLWSIHAHEPIRRPAPASWRRGAHARHRRPACSAADRRSAVDGVAA